MARDLTSLLAGLRDSTVQGRTDVAISQLAYHTNDCVPNALFVAMPGTRTDGAVFIDDAIAKGARVIVTEHPFVPPTDITCITVQNARRALAELAAEWFAHPSRSLGLIGVTGTNGKTTLTYLLEALWRATGRSPGVIGTVNYRYANSVTPAAATTPQSLDLQRLLATMREAHVTDVVMEVSSHALDQERVAACAFDGAVFTNLSQDHLDYHRDMTTYGAAKARFFTDVLAASPKKARFAVINGDDPFGATLATQCDVPVWRYGLRERTNEISARDIRSDAHGTTLTIVSPNGAHNFHMPLVGEFNVYNVLAAFTTGLSLGLLPDVMCAALSRAPQVPGRLERVTNARGIDLFVDYAHTPDALMNVLKVVKPLTRGRLITVFGCGGDRDPAKRSLMGAAVAQYADVAVVTSDNPRTEDPGKIIADILPGLSGCAHVVVADRKSAIYEAARVAVLGDSVVIAGKGHEDYQIIGTEKRHFDDCEVARDAFV